jgi:hypothetical protein
MFSLNFINCLRWAKQNNNYLFYYLFILGITKVLKKYHEKNIILNKNIIKS